MSEKPISPLRQRILETDSRHCSFKADQPTQRAQSRDPGPPPTMWRARQLHLRQQTPASDPR